MVNDSNKTKYTDRLGGVSYNQALSERRVLTVNKYLQEKGNANVIEVVGKGNADQIVSYGTANKRTNALEACLQPNRRIVVEVRGLKKVAIK